MESRTWNIIKFWKQEKNCFYNNNLLVLENQGAIDSEKI